MAIALALGIATVLLYLPVRQFTFLNWDDLSYVSTNDHVRGGLTWQGIVWSFTHSHSANWFPLTWISHMLDCQIYGLNPAGHHLTNALLHAANAALLFLLLWKVTSAVWRSALVAALFALHPFHVESVAWISERKDVLSTFFALLTLMAYAKYVSEKFEIRNSKPEGNSRDKGQKRSVFFYILALLFFALGLMSKPMLVTLPFVLLLLDFWPLNRESKVQSPKSKVWKGFFFEKTPFFALTIGSCIITVIVQKHAGAVASIQTIPLGSRLQNALVAYAMYLVKFFWPAKLSPIYPLPSHWPAWQVLGSGALLLVLSVAVWLGRKRFPFALTGWLWYLGTLVPVIGIVQVGSQAYADRYTYIPLIGIAIALVWLLAEFSDKAGRGVLTAPLLGSTPSSGAVRTPRPTSLSERAFARTNIRLIIATLVLGFLSWRTTQQLAYWRDTETLFGRVLELAPNSVQALYGLGTHLIDSGRVAEGKKLVERAVALQPTYAEALGTLGNAFDTEGNYSEALRYYESALKVAPDDPGILNNIAWLRAACPNAKYRNGQKAVEVATRACELVGYGKPLFIGTLAAAQAEAGNFQAAIATAERAAALAQSLRLDDVAARNRELIQLYREGKAAHGGAPKTGRQ